MFFSLRKVVFVVVVLRTHAPLNFSETPHIYTNHQIQILINVHKDWTDSKTIRHQLACKPHQLRDTELEEN